MKKQGIIGVFVCLLLSTIAVNPVSAEEEEIPLVEIVGIRRVPSPDTEENEGDSGTSGRPTSIRATINGNVLSVTAEELSRSAHLRVLKTNGRAIVNKPLYFTVMEQLPDGLYYIEIVTEDGTLIGNFKARFK